MPVLCKKCPEMSRDVVGAGMILIRKWKMIERIHIQ